MGKFNNRLHTVGRLVSQASEALSVAWDLTQDPGYLDAWGSDFEERLNDLHKQVHNLRMAMPSPSGKGDRNEEHGYVSIEKPTAAEIVESKLRDAEIVPDPYARTSP